MSFPRYPKYKLSGVEWLGDVPEGWEVKRLRFVASLNPSKSEIADLARDTAVSFLPMEAVGDDGTLTLDKEKTIAELETGYTYFRDGDVTIAKITPCYENGKGALMSGLTNGIGFGTTELIVARPLAPQITGTYLHYIFISPDFRGIGESHMYGAGGQKRVPDAFVRNFATAIPPLAEQTAIAEFLDRETGKIDELVAEQRRLMELLKEKRQAVISHAVTQGLNPHAPMKPSGIEWLGDVPLHWEVLAMRRRAMRIQTGGTPPTAEQSYYEDGTVPWFGPGSFNDNIVVSEPIKWLNDSAVKDGSARVFATGATLIVTIGATLGKVSSLADEGSCNQQITVIEFDQRRVCPRFATYQIKRLEPALRAIAPSATLPILGLGEIAALSMVIPPLAEQVAIVEHLDTELAKFDTLTAEAQRAIDLLQERRTALISAAVTGQIDVRNPSPKH